jgi:A/G-specific adenine glycosylase
MQSKKFDKEDIESLREFKEWVWNFYKENNRNLPWRMTTNPYEILISEIMLQQTQIPRVMLKYQQWLQLFPTINDLADSPQSEVLRAWSGLGYNRRALALHKLAKIIVEKYKNEIPLEIEKLKKLPGVGEYTAGAIYVFSTNKPATFIETNIRSVFIHHFFNDIESITDKDITSLIKETVDKENPREWYYALMDYGTFIKKEFGNPNKKSKSYSKQSKFEGSKRQLRGKILKELHAKEYLTTEDIVEFTNKNTEEISQIVNELEKEGFLNLSNGKVRLV